MNSTIRIADLFCGAGGSSTGAMQAAALTGRKTELVAVDHWDKAIETHASNHPEARHLCESLDNIDPRKLFPKGLDVLLASPECTHHSNARGGMPMSDQSRSTAWHVLRWAEALQPREILVENVREFMTWGPLGANGRPLKSRQGETFRAWGRGLRSLGYRVDFRVLNAADYGDPTTRKRLFVRASKGRSAVRWPEQTHTETPELFGCDPWRPAREIIDWGIESQSIFTRSKPLARKTLERIMAGLRKFGGIEFFHSVDAPMPVIDTNPRYALCEPFIISYYGAGGCYTVGTPLPTVTTRDRFGLVQPMALDIRFRMLQPSELAAAMGFPADYAFFGNKGDVVRQIGNAVPVNTATQLCRAMMGGLAA